MRKLLMVLTMTTGLLCAQDGFVIERKTPGKRLWQWSVTSLAAANAMDIQSSWGKHELNRALAGPGGTFGRDGALLKIGLQGGLMGMEYLLTRGHAGPRLYRALSILNFGISAGTAAVAVHNYTIPRPN